MSYTPTTWATGDVITADKLNNMESGIVNTGLFIINGSGWDPNYSTSLGTITIDKTYDEIVAAYTSGKRLAIHITTHFGTIAFNLARFRTHSGDNNAEEISCFEFNGGYLDFSMIEEAGVLCTVATIYIASQGASINSKQVAWK